MKRTTTNDIAFEIMEQDLVGNGGATPPPAKPPVQPPSPEELTAQGRCGSIYTFSYECTGTIIKCG